MDKPKQLPKRQSKLQASTNMPMALARQNQRNIRRAKTGKRKTKVRKPNENLFAKSVRMDKVPHICTLQYLSALADPENTPAGACIPYGFPTASQRVKQFIRGSFQLGTTGQGFIYANLPLANDGTAVAFSQTGSVGTSATAISAFTGVGSAQVGRLPYTTAQITASPALVSGRVVAAALKARYRGTEANRNGTVFTLEEPQHKPVNNLTGAQIEGYVQSYAERPMPEGQFHVVKYSGPVTASETQFANTSTISQPLIIFIEGAAGDAYDYEFYIHVEYCGQLPPETVISHSDPEGYGHVITATKTQTQINPLNEKNDKVTFGEALKNAGSSVLDMAMKYGPMLADVLSRRFMPSMMVGRAFPGLMQPGRPMLLGAK